MEQKTFVEKGTIFLFLFLLSSFFISLVSAQPPFQEASGAIGLDIRFPQVDVVKQNNDVNYHIHVYNKSNGLLVTNTTISCLVHLYDSTGDHVLISDMGFDENGVDNYDFSIKFRKVKNPPGICINVWLTLTVPFSPTFIGTCNFLWILSKMEKKQFPIKGKATASPLRSMTSSLMI